MVSPSPTPPSYEVKPKLLVVSVEVFEGSSSVIGGERDRESCKLARVRTREVLIAFPWQRKAALTNSEHSKVLRSATSNAIISKV
jgi:hypothetical protein